MFHSHFSLFGRKVEPFVFYNIAATEYRAITENTTEISGNIWYRADMNKAESNNTLIEPVGTTLFLNKLAIDDRKGNRFVLYILKYFLNFCW